MKRSLIILVLLAGSAVAQDDAIPVPFRLLCKNGVPVAVQVFVAVPGVIMVPIDPAGCAPPPAAKPSAPAASKPARLT